jgi:hypothetical protein
MQDDTNRNTIIFLVCAVLLFFVYQHFVLDPAMAKRQAEAKQRAAAEASLAAKGPGAPGIADFPQRGAGGQPARADRDAGPEGLGRAEGRAHRRPVPHPVP